MVEQHPQPLQQSLRLNKFLAASMGVSRREADGLIVSGKVKVNGAKAVLGARVGESDKVEVGGQFVSRKSEFVYLALNKPAGYVCSRKRQGDAPTLYELLPKEYRSLKTVGRLDKDSSGLVLLTDDGDFAYEMTHPKFFKMKVYEVELDWALQPLHQQMLADFGVDLTDGKSRLGLMALDESRLRWRVEMSEGRNRQIRRSFGALGYTVVGLHRIQFGKYGLDGLGDGEYKAVELK